jgi:hypothetical protein
MPGHLTRHPHVPAEVAASPWRTMAADAAREWWRDHPGAPLDEYDAWVYAELEPQMLRGMGVPAGWRRLTATQRAALDAIHVGLAEGAALRRQRAA